ncbi:LysR family transcriptional regulator [Variovorax ginsengisoli]|uniref:DNA-binding transcriptional LysR family regulator n=1 Tax=Variovorax ginsengisoli TaxID=363844 RepID=A0ABT9S9U7_9BURK|nr:LysR family transcriptional regulator [Variovorax ginsengisoli]MDP9901137.1 DNA-binding transcriptional LysR family regulator [Variovorax ginsengisoli]
MNLLRLFEAVYRLGSVSHAAEALGLSQPAASQGLTRLRLALHDALFVRAAGRMRPTLRAERLAAVVLPALGAIHEVLREDDRFDPPNSRMTLRLHLSDIGEARLLPELMEALHHKAPGMRVQTHPLQHHEIADALETGAIHFALGFLPSVTGIERMELLNDSYAVVVRAGHPLLTTAENAKATTERLRKLQYVAVRSHAETIRILKQLGLEDRLVLSSAHFLALPAIIARTDLAVVMPRAIALGFMDPNRYAVLPEPLPRSSFNVSLHWSRRFEKDPAHRWLRDLFKTLFAIPHINADLQGLGQQSSRDS